jgi:hypothetical protein
MSQDGSLVIPPGPLTLAPGLRTRVDAAGHVLVETPLGGIVDTGPDGLAILALFSRPRTAAEAMADLDSGLGRRPDLMPAKAAIVQLVTAGAIVEPGGESRLFGWTDPAEHARMLSDVRRTDAYLAAIRSAVRPGDIVIDIGTGSGILAVAAAKAGADRVYAIEASDIAAVARRVFEDNGVADRVTLVEGWSSDVELPERANVLVTETLGVEPFEEDILGTVLDARRRLLVPGARLIPGSLRLAVQPLSIPDPQRWASRIDEEDVKAWRKRFGMDLQALRAARRRVPLHWPVDSRIVAEWEALTPPTVLLGVDLETHVSSSAEAEVRLRVSHSGVVDAILVSFGADLGPDQRFVHVPRRGETSSWDASVWFLPDGLAVEAGGSLQIGYRFCVPGRPDGLTCERWPERV